MNFLRGIKKTKKLEVRTILSNISSLTVVNLLNYIFPLILIPYLIRTISVTKYGLHSFSFSFLQYFVLLVNYGFQFSATKQLAIVREDKIKVNEIYSSVLIARLLLALVSTILILILIFSIPTLKSELLLFIYGIGIFWGQAIIPIWLYQGLEKMKYITLIIAVSKIVTFVLIVLYIKTPDDYEKVNLFYSIGFIASGLFGLIMAKIIFGITLILPKKEMIIEQFRSGWHLFISTVGMNLYRETNIVILGFLVPYNFVGYYSAADKIIRVIKSLVSPVSQALFPFFGRKLQDESINFSHNLKQFHKIGRTFSLFMFFLTLVTAISAPFLVTTFLGKGLLRTTINIEIMSVSIIFGAMNYYYGILGLINLNYERSFTFYVWITGLISIALCVPLSLFINEYGASISSTFAEIILFGMIICKLRKIK